MAKRPDHPDHRASHALFDVFGAALRIQAAYAHNETYTEQCAFLNSGYTGSFQAQCRVMKLRDEIMETSRVCQRRQDWASR